MAISSGGTASTAAGMCHQVTISAQPGSSSLYQVPFKHGSAVFTECCVGCILCVSNGNLTVSLTCLHQLLSAALEYQRRVAYRVC